MTPSDQCKTRVSRRVSAPRRQPIVFVPTARQVDGAPPAPQHTYDYGSPVSSKLVRLRAKRVHYPLVGADRTDCLGATLTCGPSRLCMPTDASGR